MERFTEKLSDGRIVLKHDYYATVFNPRYGHFIEGEAVDRLAEYEGLEEQGKLLKLPVLVGGTVWDNDFGQPCSYTVTGFSFGKIDDDEENDIEGLQMYYRNYNGSIRCSCAVSEIGKTIFLTQEEAKKALTKKGR